MGEFELTEGQKQFMGMMERFMKAPPPMPAVLTGVAGSGKTTLLRAAASVFGAPIVLAPTGKAALRVKEATGVEAMTIHRWLYSPKENQHSGEVEFKLKAPDLVQIPGNGLVVVDEASMVSRDVWEHLWDMCQMLNLRILLVGDPFQLPPVERKQDENAISFVPLLDVETPYRSHLSEITRQAMDSPIIRAGMIVRENGNMDDALGLLKRVFSKDFDQKALEVYQAGGMVICHKNDTRHRINKTIRGMLGYHGALQPGEPLLVTRNNYDINRYNGEVVKYQNWLQYDEAPVAVRDTWRNVSQMLTFGNALVDDQSVMLCPEQVVGDTQLMGDSPIQKASRRYYGDWYAKPGVPTIDGDGQYVGPPHVHANLGYALSCHRAQGSQKEVALVLIERSVRMNTFEGRRWVYTALTRAIATCYISVER